MAQNKSSFVVQSPNALTDVLNRASIASSESTLRQAAVAGARVFLAEMQIRAPRRTGKLAESLLITYAPEESVTGMLATYLVTFNQDAWYARLLEVGTSEMAAEPFIRPAFEAKKQEAAAVVIEKIQEAVKLG